MRIKTITTIVIALGLVFSACKKPENGNKITLTTKKHRITERWTMVKGKAGLTEYANGSAYNSNFEFTQGHGFLTQTGTYIIYTLSYNLFLEFKKNGDFHLTEDFNGLTMDCDGTWDFNKKDGEKKRKEDVELEIKNVSTEDLEEHIFNHLVSSIPYTIRVLSKDELTMSASTTYTTSTNRKISIQSEYTFKKQQ